MYDYYITFRSVTRAQMGAEALEHQHIPFQLLRAPRAIADKGCAYALRVEKDTVRSAVDACHRAGVGFQRVFVEAGQGFEEAAT